MANCRCGNRLDSKGYCHECQQYDTSHKINDFFERRCGICKKLFKNLSFYMDHLESHPLCELCKERFISEKALNEHFESYHKCSICSEYFPFVSEHVVWSHPYCEFCKERFLTRDIFKEHMNAHPKCGHCGENFRDKVKLVIHIEEMHKCRVCQKCFSNLKEHMNKKHPFCRYCNRYFVDENAYKQHNLKEHTHQCTYCSKIFKQRTELDIHLTSVHICSSCNEYFDDLRQHFIDKHLYCERCKKPFFTAYEYNMDKRAHEILDKCVYELPPRSSDKYAKNAKNQLRKTNNPKNKAKKVKCPYCVKLFISDHARDQHVKAVHPNKL